ncbi:hypothetical protein G6O69_28180 [Pseudenhygromyxa sp. WMMC2535]|uniref:hypothetical protein n=1 Tax=Pseudenhygromyxa sp. WMMC2535 TaxID=2712867 RepID=UPI0015582375|nr:hypothetical protein [Pseudenhygromyxa sp. WMMC2535]NVB41745.1 hypothetical protein [Pseudenhygromyxa sp. WMMC2535]
MGKKIAVALLIVALAAALVLGVMWQRLTALPQWYESPEMLSEEGAPQVDQGWVRVPLAELPPRQRSMVKKRGEDGDQAADAYQVRNPHLRRQGTAKRSAAPSAVAPAIRASRATYVDGQLDGGAVLNLGELDVDELSAKEQKAYRRLVEAFPALTGRDVYVGLEGAGKDAEGKVALLPDTKLRVGNSRYSLRKAAKRLGMSEAKLRAQIERELGRMSLELPAADG